MNKPLLLPDQFKKYLLPVFERKALTVKALNVQDLTSYTDVLVVVEAASNRQATAISQHVVKSLKDQKIQALGIEGIKEGEWALLDYGQIIIHVFESSAKDFYDLEGFWADAPFFDLSELDAIAEAENDEA